MDKFVYVGKPFRCCEGRYGAAFRFGRVFGEFFFAVYSRGQRAKRACLHAHLATAARVKYPDALQRCKFDAPLLAAGVLTVRGLPALLFTANIS